MAAPLVSLFFQELFATLLPADARNVLKDADIQNPSTKPSAAADPISLEEVKRIKTKFPGATVNDVIQAVTTLTIQRYFREVGQEPVKIRGQFMVNMRPAGEDVIKHSVGNRFAFGNFSFPLHETDPVKLIWVTKQHMDIIKISLSVVTLSIVKVLSPLLAKSPKWTKPLLENILGKITLQLTNVPGPATEVSFCGQPVDSIMFYAFGPVGAFFGVVSYKGHISLGVVTGINGVPDAARVTKHWGPAFQELVRAVGDAPASSFKPPRPSGDMFLVASLVAVAAVAISLARLLRAT